MAWIQDPRTGQWINTGAAPAPGVQSGYAGPGIDSGQQANGQFFGTSGGQWNPDGSPKNPLPGSAYATPITYMPDVSRPGAAASPQSPDGGQPIGKPQQQPVANLAQLAPTGGGYTPGGVEWPGAGVGQLTLDGPNGQTQTVDAGNYQQIDQLTRSGWVPIDGQGQPYRVMDWQGGQVFVDSTGAPKTLNMLLGSQPTAAQAAELQSPAFTQAIQSLPTPQPRQAPAAGASVASGTAGTAGGAATTGTTDEFGGLFGLDAISSVPNINLGDMPMNRGGWAPGFSNDYFGNANAVKNDIGSIYNSIPVDRANAAQLDINGIPQPQSRDVASNPALQHLVSGQGFDPATLARLHAASNDVIAANQRSAQGSARLAAEQAGQAGGGGEMAMVGQANRQAGDARTRASNDIEIQNAQTGMENMRQGAGLELGRATTNATQANMIALQNASQMLQAMQQNTANVQQTSLANSGAQNQHNQALAQTQGDFMANTGSTFNQASTAKAAAADTQNSANALNWRLNQVNLDRGAATANAGIRENRWGVGTNGLISLANGAAPANYTNQGNYLIQGQTPNTVIPSAVVNAGLGLLAPK